MEKKISLKKIGGIILIVLGVIGLFTPFLQGILFITIGSTMLGDKRILNLILKVKRGLIKKFKK